VLFFLHPGSNKTGSVGEIIGDYLLDSSWTNVEDFLTKLTLNKNKYRSFNYIQLEMSKTTGRYDLFYLNNNDTKSYQKMNPNDRDRFIFALSNSDLARPYNKVKNGRTIFEQIIDSFENKPNKTEILHRLFYDLLHNETENFPDQNLKAFMNIQNDDLVRNVSKLNADYGSFWKNAHTRTSSVILIDYNDNIEYHELNLTSWTNEANSNIRDKEWVKRSLRFNLKPLYKNDSNSKYETNAKMYFIYFFTSIFSFYFKFN
jgi:uncharacterized protein with NRDE domain